MSTINISFQKKITYIKKVNFCALVLILFISFLSSCSTTKFKTTASALILNSAKKSNVILNKIKIKSTEAPMIIFSTHLLQNETNGINSPLNITLNTTNPLDSHEYPDLNNSPLSTVSAFSLTQIKSKTLTSSKNLISKQVINTPSDPVTSNPPQTTQQNQGSLNIKKVEPLSDPSDPYAFATTKVKCSANNCSLPNLCVADFICKCSKESANYFSKEETEKNSKNLDMKYCLYSRKKQIVSFLLEFFIMPVGHFYSGNYFVACIKILFPIFIIILLFMKGDTYKLIGSTLGCMLSVWWLIDAVLYGTNSYKDQNGVKLELW